MIKGPKKMVGVLMSLELYDTIKALAEEEGRSIPGYIRLVLQQHVKEAAPVQPAGEKGSF